MNRPVKDDASPPNVSSPLAQALIKPQQQEKTAPCSSGCATGGDVRRWIAVVAQREKLGLTEKESFTHAWRIVTEVNPFPATLGRICPHPCESGCSRRGKDGAVSINALERFLGDWALQQRLPLQHLLADMNPESIGVIGAGPAGLSFAYQLARRNYPVTVYERQEKPGGMLYYGIPQYRLPENILNAEIQRILDLGVVLKLNFSIGKDTSLEQLRQKHDVLFLGIGAGIGSKLCIPGEDGANVWSGTDFLGHLNRGEPVELGDDVIVVGGGNTAVDAARSARRCGARVTMLYRRTQNEMPAIEAEIQNASNEGVNIEFLTAPVEIRRDGDNVKAVVIQRMQLSDPDDSGRRKSLPITGSEFELRADCVITAISQEPDWYELGDLDPGTVWIRTGDHGKINDNLWAGGDALGIGIAGMAIAQGRQAAEAVHARLRGGMQSATLSKHVLPEPTVKAEFYPEKTPVSLRQRSVEERLAKPNTEIYNTISNTEFLQEISRCFSCGLCNGCENCYMYCNAGGFTRLEQVEPGAYFAFSADYCMRCGKCIDLCPTGYLSQD